MRALVMCVVLLAGCKDKPAATKEACDAAVAKLAWADPPKATLAAQCVATNWSAATIDCIAKASDPATCTDKMTADQRSAYTTIATIVEKEAQARADMAKAQVAAAQAADQARQAAEVVERLEQQATDLQKRVTDATDALVGAGTQADRDTAKAALDQLVREKAELEMKVADAKAKAARAERMKGVAISKECLDNPLAKGCD